MGLADLWSQQEAGGMDTRGVMPELAVALRQGYDGRRLVADLNAGFAVAVLALPLSLAIAIASGVPPMAGIVTTVIGGLLISAFGGTRHQIGGPAAAFIVVIAAVVAQHGAQGLAAATMLAGSLLLVAAWLKLGSLIRHIPRSVVTGFMSGVGVVIAVNQFKDALGLEQGMPAAMLAKLGALWSALGGVRWAAVIVTAVTVAIVLLVRRVAPRWPGLAIAVAVGSLLAAGLGGVATIESRFGALPTQLPAPALPALSLDALIWLMPTVLLLTFLIGVESLLSAVIADAQGQARDPTQPLHNPNAELVGQGLANIVSPLFGGLPATGVIARTATNINAGAETPLAGIFHAGIVGLALVFIAPLAGKLALPCLAGALLVTAWRLLEIHEIRHVLADGSLRDRAALAVTWLLTVFASLEIAIAAGLGVAYLLRARSE